MEIRITKGNPADRDIVARFQVEMAEESEGTSLNGEVVRKGVEAVLLDPAKGTYYLARNEKDEIMGSLLVTKEWSDWNNCDYWWIESVYVSPQYRGQKVFSTLYSEVRRLAREAGANSLRLYVDRHNLRAQSTYKKLGMDECHYLMYEENL